MSEIELRELDARVHRVLYPGDDVSHILDFGPRLTYVGERVFRTSSRRWMRLPHYSTDIGAWEPVYALHPEWRWSIADSVDGTETHVWLMGAGYYRSIPKGRGSAAWALGMARCVLAWAAGRGEG